MKLGVWMLMASATIGSPAISAAASSAHPSEVHVGILMFNGVQIIDFAAPYEVFGQAGYKVSTVSVDGKPITTWMSLKVTPDLSFANAPEFDVLLVPGGHIDGAAKDQQTQQWLKAHAAKADVTLSVCTGSHILAASGLLENLTATTFHTAFGGLAAMSPSTKVVRDARWVDNGKIITSAGLSSGIDAALHVVERLSGPQRARTVALNLEYNWDAGQGFIRGVMADRYIEQVPMQFPEGSRLEHVFGYGDKSQWTEQIRVTATAPAERYLQAITAVYTEQRGWTTERATKQELQLRRKSVQGGDVRMLVSVKERDQPQTFDLNVAITVKE